MSEAFRKGQLVVVTSEEGIPPKDGYRELKPPATSLKEGEIDVLANIMSNSGRDPFNENGLVENLSIVRIVEADPNLPTVFPVLGQLGHHSKYRFRIPAESLVCLTPEILFKLVIPNAIASIGFGRKKLKNK